MVTPIPTEHSSPALRVDGEGLYVEAQAGRWVIYSNTSNDRYIFDDFEEAMRHGGELSRSRKLPLIVI